MKVWIDNLKANEQDIDDNELAERFLKSDIRKKTMECWPIARQLLMFLMNERYTYEFAGFNKLLNIVRSKKSLFTDL